RSGAPAWRRRALARRRRRRILAAGSGRRPGERRMSQETILVMSARMDEPLRRLVGEACEHARVHPVFWDGATSEAGAENPSLVVAALPAGERTIPQDVAVLVTQTFRALPLLLLCEEALVRNSISLQGGR